MKFECKQCGNCCNPSVFYGDNRGYVLGMSPIDILRAAQCLNITIDELCNKYKIKNGSINCTHTACTFLDETHHCIINNSKPLPCQRWPWIGKNTTIEGQIESSKLCPGIIVEMDNVSWQ